MKKKEYLHFKCSLSEYCFKYFGNGLILEFVGIIYHQALEIGEGLTVGGKRFLQIFHALN